MSCSRIYTACRFYEIFNELLPERAELLRRTEWPIEQIDTIEHYKNSNAIYSFPTRNLFLSVFARGFSGVRFVQSGSYELSERCPILVMEKC